MFRLFHYFVAFTLEEPFLSRRNIFLRKFSSFFTIYFWASFILASDAGVFRGARISSLRAPLKTPAWEATFILGQSYFFTTGIFEETPLFSW